MQIYIKLKIGFNEVNLKNKKINKLNKFDVHSDLSQFHKIISEKTDFIIFAISGLNGLDLLLRMLKSGKRLGIANKECIISLGYRLNSISKKYLTQVIPLDSEHNSIYHLLKNNYENFKSITITSRALFIIVAESIEIFFPIFQTGCRIACLGVTSFKLFKL